VNIIFYESIHVLFAFAVWRAVAYPALRYSVLKSCEAMPQAAFGFVANAERATKPDI
jgi:hypothetical protein